VVGYTGPGNAGCWAIIALGALGSRGCATRQRIESGDFLIE
jgi:hypothetical protein